MRRLAFFFIIAPITVLSATAFENSIRVNGKSVPGSMVMVGGKPYIPLSALKAAGAKVVTANGVTSIEISAAGGANQQDGVEGKIGDWLYNGIWRFRVTNIAKQSDPSGWTVAVEIKNGTNSNGYAPAGTGWQGVTLVLVDGTVVTARSDAPELRDSPINQAAGNKETLYFDTDSPSEPDRLILRFDPKGVEGTPLKFSVGDPSFRVHLK